MHHFSQAQVDSITPTHNTISHYIFILICLSICLPQSIYLSVCLSVCLSMYRSIHPSIYLPNNFINKVQERVLHITYNDQLTDSKPISTDRLTHLITVRRINDWVDHGITWCFFTPWLRCSNNNTNTNAKVYLWRNLVSNLLVKVVFSLHNKQSKCITDRRIYECLYL